MNLLVRKWGEHIVRSRQYAAAIALVFAFLSFFDLPVGWISTVVIALVTLQGGARQGLIVMSWTVLPAVAMLYLGQTALFLNVVLLHYLIAWLFALTMRRYNSVAILLQMSAVLASMAVLIIHLYIPDLQAWWINQLTAIAKEYKSVVGFGIQSKAIDIWLQYATVIATGLLVVAVLITNLFKFFLARSWQSFINPSVDIKKECHQIRLHYLSAIALIALIAGVYFNTQLFMNIFPVAVIPFAIAGLSLIHAFCGTKKNGVIVLVIVYSLLIVFSQYILLLLTTLAWLDSFFNFRKKFVSENIVEE